MIIRKEEILEMRKTAEEDENEKCRTKYDELLTERILDAVNKEDCFVNVTFTLQFKSSAKIILNIIKEAGYDVKQETEQLWNGCFVFTYKIRW